MSHFQEAVSGLYKGWLGREADLDGLAYWSNKLESGAMNVAQVSNLIGHSTEANLYQEHRDAERPADFVRTAYAEILYRTPDDGGLSYWTKAITSGSTTYNNVVDQIRGSVEAQNKAVMEEIAGLYHAFLNRPVDASGLKFWMHAFNSGEASMSQIAAGIRGSQEGLLATPKTLSSSELVDDLYLRLYNRQADTDTKHKLVAQLDAGEALSDLGLDLATYANISNAADRSTLRATNLKDYMLIRDEYKALALHSVSNHDTGPVYSIAPDGSTALLAATDFLQIIGTEGPDNLVATGSETIWGRGGNDTIQGGPGVNALHGEAGDDTIYGGSGIDSEITGGTGNDVIYAQGGNARVIRGGAGDDIIYAGTNQGFKGARIYGDEGHDVYHYSVSDWQNNRDYIVSGGGNDVLALDNIDQDFSLNAENVGVSRIHLFGNHYQSTYTMYINPGVWIDEIDGLREIGALWDFTEIKILAASTPFNSSPTAEYQNWKKGSYRDGGDPVDQVDSVGEWFSYRDVAGNGYITYFDERNGHAQTIELVGAALSGSVVNGTLYVS